MLRWLVAALSLSLAATSHSLSAGSRPGAFDYWVLALSWSPQYCESQPSDPQCRRAHDFIVHGLWPQHERGYPDFCHRQPARVPSTVVRQMLDLMPSENLIQHQWRKHGTCSGLPLKDYFKQIERARNAVVVPPDLRTISSYRQTSLTLIERSFIAANPALKPAGIAVQCQGQWLREVRICMDQDLRPRRCGVDVNDRCGNTVVMRPARPSHPAR